MGSKDEAKGGGGRQTHVHISDQEQRRPTTDALVYTQIVLSADSYTGPGPDCTNPACCAH